MPQDVSTIPLKINVQLGKLMHEQAVCMSRKVIFGWDLERLGFCDYISKLVPGPWDTPAISKTSLTGELQLVGWPTCLCRKPHVCVGGGLKGRIW